MASPEVVWQHPRVRVEDIFARVLGLEAESLSDDSTPANTAGWDSLNALKLVAALESGLNVRLSMREIVRMNSLREVKAVLRSKGVDV
jgi:acyl carrier protein